MIINYENLFLIVLAIIWIIGAVLQDLRRREVDNIWNFSLIGIALAYRAGVSVFTSDYWFLLNGIFGFILFLFIGNLFYYSRVFAGGDAKLLIALGAVLPFSYDWIVNLKIFAWFVLLFLLMGSFYVLIWSIVLVFRNFKKFFREFKIYSKKYGNFFIFGFILFLLWIIVVYFINNQILFLLFGFVFLLFPLLFVFAKAVEESCMIRNLSPSEVTEGDWLYKDIFILGKRIKASWDGVSASELKLIRKKYHGKILVKFGVPFTPGFLFGFLVLLYLMWKFAWVF